MTRPTDPFAETEHAAFAPTAVRSVDLFGRRCDLAWLPDRRKRAGVPSPLRPLFRADRVPHILAEEAVWTDGSLALTPNLFPFVARQMLLWTVEPIREPNVELLHAGMTWAENLECTVLWNSVGAAASIPRAHLHLLPGVGSGFLAAETRAWQLGTEIAIRASQVELPFAVLELHGPAIERAEAATRLLTMRACAAANLVTVADRTWFVPRSDAEIPGGAFPYALGASELWGQWCFPDEEAFRAADGPGLERALRASTRPVECL